MPELPEVETIARTLDRELRGACFDRVRVARKDILYGDPRPLGRLVSGRRVASVYRRAKRVVIDLGEPVQMVVHLGMTGRLLLSNKTTKREKHTHLRIGLLGTDRELRFQDPRRFGGVWCLTDRDDHKGRKLGPLGPEPLTLRLNDFRHLLNRSRQIKALLLDQTVIAGLGNIYCDEALHAVGVHPLTQANNLTDEQAQQLLRAIKRILRRAIRFGGSTWMDYRQPDGRRGSFQEQHRVYNREGKPCRTCGSPIIRIQAAGRSSSLCPLCQAI